MIGAEFTGVLHAAQQGRVGAFLRLWADVQPALTRYLRVVTVADADDIATESWVAVVRRLRAFEGDETAWRAMVFRAARMHAQDENQRRVWDAMVEDDEVTAVVAAPLPPGEEPFEADELDGPAHGLRMAIEAVRDLPPEQGEVLMLRRVAGLPAQEVADLVGADPQLVHGLEQQALDQLGLDAELLAWALDAEARPVELADETVVVSIYRATVPESVPSPSVLPEGRSANGARVIALKRPTWRTRAGAAAAASAAVLGLGAFSAAAYQGVLPDPVQNVMHVVIGAPEATPESDTASAAPPKTAAGAPTTATAHASTGPDAASASSTRGVELPRGAVVALCRIWEREREHPVTRERSTAFLSLAENAGGADLVDRYCANNGVPLAPMQAQPGTTGPARSPDASRTAKPEVTKDKPVQRPSQTTSVPVRPTRTDTPTQVPTSTPPTTSVPEPTGTTTVPPPTGGVGGSDGGGQGAPRSTENPGAAKAQEQRPGG